MHKLFSTVVLLLLAGGLLAVLAAPAAAVEPTSGQGSSRVLSSSCAQTTKSTGTYARIAGKVRMREFGKQHVVRLRVVWQLYRTATPGRVTRWRATSSTGPAGSATTYAARTSRAATTGTTSACRTPALRW